MTPRIATNNGQDVQDVTEQIREEALAGLIVGLGEHFQADNLQWAEGFHKAFNDVMSPASPEAQHEARLHLIELLKGDMQ